MLPFAIPVQTDLIHLTCDPHRRLYPRMSPLSVYHFPEEDQPRFDCVPSALRYCLSQLEAMIDLVMTDMLRIASSATIPNDVDVAVFYVSAIVHATKTLNSQ